VGWYGRDGNGEGGKGRMGGRKESPQIYFCLYAPEDVSVTLLSSGITSIVVEGYMPHVLAAL